MNRDLPPSPVVRRHLATRIARGIVATAASVSLICAWAPAQADELDDRKVELQQQMSRQAVVIKDAHATYDSAVVAAQQARANLADAESKLARAEADLDKAEELDKKRAEELATAEAELRQAKADVAAAKAALDSVNRRLNEEILVTTQQNHGLLNLALLFTDVTTSNLNQRAQLARTLFDSSARELDELEMRRLMLEDAEAAADAAEAAATAAREAAAAQLVEKQEASKLAEDLRAEVAQLVKERDAAELAAKDQIAAEESRQAALEAENADVEKRIKQRIEAERKAAAEKAAREKAAREKAAREKAAREKAAREAAARAAAQQAAANRAAADKAAAQKAAAAKKAAADKAAAEAARKRQASRSSSKGSKPAPVVAAPKPAPTSPFIRPVQGRLTSNYGMRLHPVLGYWKLHDGTDFGAACGTPIRAAAGGVVSQRYFNAGYGNRLMIDHGKVKGSYVTTGYNHASRYTVGVGQRVVQGQVVGYVGSTGYSTGCHLHLMVWQNGSLVNPMAKWFG